MELFNNIKFWFSNARPYTIPITSLSFLVIFIYSLSCGGNIIRGFIAYIGVSIVHLATNLCDDYFDYKSLIKNSEFYAKDCKCMYLRNGSATINDLRNVIVIMMLCASFTGLVLFFMSGYYVLLFALCALPIALFYSKLSARGLGDIAVITAYGPLMFEGVYYVMCRDFSWNAIFLGFACAIIVNTVLFTHMLMDFDDDIAANKTTLCTRLGSKMKALNVLLCFYLLSFVLIIFFIFLTKNYYCLLVFLTLPLIIKLYNSLKIFNENSQYLPDIQIWNYPLSKKKQLPVNAPFFHRFFFSINISTCFMILMCISIILFKILK